MSHLKLTSISKKLGNFSLDDLNFSLEGPGLFALCGESGSGKSTILNIIFGIIQPDSGSIENSFNAIHYVLVEDNNFDSLTVEDNIRLSTQDSQAIKKIITELELDAVSHKKCSLLSKGERERVAIARALVSEEPLVLIDEPTANLDEKTSQMIFKALSKYSSSKTILIATHEVKLAGEYCDKIINIASGKIVSKCDSTRIKVDLEPEKESTSSKKQPWKIYVKSAWRSVCQKRFFFALNTVSLLIAFLSLFSLTAFFNIDVTATVKNEINSNFPPFTYILDTRYDRREPLASYYKSAQLNSDDCIPVFQLSNDLFTMPVSFYENARTIYNFDREIANFKENFPQYADESYFPIFMSEEYLSYLAETKELEYAVGQKIPLFNDDNHIINFILAGTFISGSGKIDSYHCFPALIPFSSYKYHIATSGLIFSGFSTFFSNFIMDYKTFCGDNNISYPKPFSDNLNNYIRSTEYLSDDEIIYGSKPVADDEILLPESDLVDVIINNKNPLIADFLEQYKDGFPLLYSMRLDAIPTKVKVVGFYRSSETNSVITTAHLYQQLVDFALIDPSISFTHSLLMSKQYLLNHTELMLNSTIAIDENLFDPSFFLTTIPTWKIIFSTILGLFSFISILSSSIFINSILKKNYKTFSLINLIGKPKGHSIFLYFMIMLIITAAPFLLSAIGAVPFMVGISYLVTNLNLGGSYIVYSYFSCYSIMLLALIVILTAFLPFIWRIRGRKLLRLIADE